MSDKPNLIRTSVGIPPMLLEEARAIAQAQYVDVAAVLRQAIVIGMATLRERAEILASRDKQC